MGLRSPIHVHVPLARLGAHLPVLLGERIAPEVALASGQERALADPAGAALVRELVRSGLPATIHAPFGEFDPGAPDRADRERCRAAMRAVLESAAELRPLAVVFHPGLPPGAAGPEAAEHAARARDTWLALAPLPAGLDDTWIAIENIYERSPEPLAHLLGSLPSPPFGFCLDVGHALMFSGPALDPWFDRLGDRLREVHLHDNDGRTDAHRPPGRGAVGFRDLFRLLASVPQAVVGTLEMHSLPEVREGLAALRAHGVA